MSNAMLRPAFDSANADVNHLLLSLWKPSAGRTTLAIHLKAISNEAWRRSAGSSRQVPWATPPLDNGQDGCPLRHGHDEVLQAMSQYNQSSPWDYLIDCRLQWAACQLRKSPSPSVTQIALASGFSTGQYFATCFRKRFHCTPREYRTQGSDLQKSS